MFDFTGELTEAEWLHDLRTTKAPQAKGELRNSGAYCCLGRACVKDKRVKPSRRKHGENEFLFLGEEVDSSDFNVWIEDDDGLDGHTRPVLSWMSIEVAHLCTIANDIVGMSFKAIADWWEAGRPVDKDGVPVPVEPKGS